MSLPINLDACALSATTEPLEGLAVWSTTYLVVTLDALVGGGGGPMDVGPAPEAGGGGAILWPLGRPRPSSRKPFPLCCCCCGRRMWPSPVGAAPARNDRNFALKNFTGHPRAQVSLAYCIASQVPFSIQKRRNWGIISLRKHFFLNYGKNSFQWEGFLRNFRWQIFMVA